MSISRGPRPAASTMSARCMRLQTIRRARKSECRDGLDAFALGVAHRRNADFQLGHAEGIEATRDVDFLVETEGDTRGLFAVAEGGVVDDDVGSGFVGHGGHGTD
jgi:hypothetical protein